MGWVTISHLSYESSHNWPLDAGHKFWLIVAQSLKYGTLSDSRSHSKKLASLAY